MTTPILTCAALRPTEAGANPEYACQVCGVFHADGPCPPAALEATHRLVARMVREADDRVPPERRARRTLQEMAPGYERQPVLILYRPPVLPATPAGGGQQCDVCGGVFGAAPAQPAGPVTAWTCGACQSLGY